MQDKRWDASIPHAVVRLFREQNRIYGRAVEPFGVSAEQAHLLALLWTRGPLAMGELGREAALSSGTLSAAIDRMEASGLVRRQADPRDRRGVVVFPARFSEEKRERLLATLLDVEGAMYGVLSAAERRTLFALMGRVLDALSSAGSAAASATSARAASREIPRVKRRSRRA